MIPKCTKCSTVQRLWTKLRHFWRYLLPGTRFVRIALRKKWDKRGQCVSFIKICHKTSLLFVCCFFFLFFWKRGYFGLTLLYLPVPTFKLSTYLLRFWEGARHGLLYKWTELLYLTCPHEADLLTLIMSQKPTQYLSNFKKILF